MFTGGASFAGMDTQQVLNFQTALLKTQMALEDAFTSVAAASNNASFVLCDRGSCDGRAYMSPEMWNTMLSENGWDMVTIRDARYELVVHLTTAADGAKDYYTLANNRTRTESPEEAIRLDHKTRAAWVGHPHLRLVDNRTGFREKINRVDARISELAGVHLSKRIVRKFLVRTNAKDMPDAEDFIVEQTFLARETGEDVQESLRRRGKNRCYTFVHKVRRGAAETKRQITNREYISLLAHCDTTRRTVRIRRQCFLYAGRYFVLDCVQNVSEVVTLLRCHCEEGDEGVKVPPQVAVEREVTGEREFSMHLLSLNVVPERVRTTEVVREEPVRFDEQCFARSL